MTLGGAPMQNVASDLRSDGTTWTLDRLEFRAPGFTQVKVDGRLYPLGKGLGFAGGANVDSNDPKNLVAWLAGQATTTAQFKPWRAKGDVTLRADRIAVEQLRTEIDRGVVEGSVSYAWPAGDRPARLDGELRAAELDLDGVLGFGESALSGLGLERPGEVTLAIDIGRAKIAGFDARNIAARLKLDAGGLAIERLSIGDLGDTAFVATGRIQTQSSPGGSITVNLECARSQRHPGAVGTVCAGAGRAAAPSRGPPEDRDAASQRQHGKQRRRWRQRQDRPHRQESAPSGSTSRRARPASARRSW